MYFSFQGTIAEKGPDYVVIEVGGVGYQVYVPHVEDYVSGQNAKIYVYDVVREDENYLAGFSSLEEKKAFLLLISAKGIGPRTALNALSATRAAELFRAIGANNVAFLKHLPGIGSKAAAQIILDVRGKLSFESKTNPTQYKEVRDALKRLGFRVKEIDNVLASISVPGARNEEILRLALKKLGR